MDSSLAKEDCLMLQDAHPISQDQTRAFRYCRIPRTANAPTKSHRKETTQEGGLEPAAHLLKRFHQILGLGAQSSGSVQLGLFIPCSDVRILRATSRAEQRSSGSGRRGEASSIQSTPPKAFGARGSAWRALRHKVYSAQKPSGSWSASPPESKTFAEPEKFAAAGICWEHATAKGLGRCSRAHVHN